MKNTNAQAVTYEVFDGDLIESRNGELVKKGALLQLIKGTTISETPIDNRVIHDILSVRHGLKNPTDHGKTYGVISTDIAKDLLAANQDKSDKESAERSDYKKESKEEVESHKRACIAEARRIDGWVVFDTEVHDEYHILIKTNKHGKTITQKIHQI